MALCRDADGVTHLPDIFDGGTFCGRSLSEMVEFINPPHDPASCEACLSGGDDTDEPAPLGPEDPT